MSEILKRLNPQEVVMLEESIVNRKYIYEFDFCFKLKNQINLEDIYNFLKESFTNIILFKKNNQYFKKKINTKYGYVPIKQCENIEEALEYVKAFEIIDSVPYRCAFFIDGEFLNVKLKIHHLIFDTQSIYNFIKYTNIFLDGFHVLIPKKKLESEYLNDIQFKNNNIKFKNNFVKERTVEKTTFLKELNFHECLYEIYNNYTKLFQETFTFNFITSNHEYVDFCVDYITMNFECNLSRKEFFGQYAKQLIANKKENTAISISYIDKKFPKELQSINEYNVDVDYLLSFEIFQKEDKLEVNSLYSTNIFNKYIVEKLVLGSNPPKKTKENCDVEKTNIEGMIERYLLNPKIFYRGNEFTSVQIFEKINYFKSKIKSNTRVIIKMERSFEYICFTLFCTIHNVTFIPVLLDVNENRLDEIKRITRANYIVLENTEIEVLESELSYVEEELYILFTSGSTGNPKGVPIKKKALHNTLCASIDNFQTKNNKWKILIKTPIVFDVSIWEIFLSIYSCAEMYVLEQNIEKNIDELVAEIERTKCNFIYFPNSQFNQIIKYLELYSLQEKMQYVRTIILGADKITDDILSFATSYREKFDIYNTYGPTECSITTHYNKISDTMNTSIGHVGDNIQCLVVDEENISVEDGIVGELLISGIQVTEGYLNGLHSEKFIYIDDIRYYKTNDLVRKLGDTYFYISRNDSVVKIGGKILNCDEISDIMLKNKEVEFCYVFKKNNLLQMYIKTSFSYYQIVAKLKEKLENYMIPHVNIVDEVVRNKNGKIDYTFYKNKEFINVSLISDNCDQQTVFYKCVRKNLQNDRLDYQKSYFENGGNSITFVELCMELSQKLNQTIRIGEHIGHTSIDEMLENIVRFNVSEVDEEYANLIIQLDKEIENANKGE